MGDLTTEWKYRNNFVEATDSHCSNCAFARTPSVYSKTTPVYKLATHIVCKILRDETHLPEHCCLVHRLSSCKKFKSI